LRCKSIPTEFIWASFVPESVAPEAYRLEHRSG
jgi:hypothetical protein